MTLRDIRNKRNVAVEPGPPSLIKHLFIFAALILITVGVTWYFHGEDQGRIIAEKLATQAAMPIGILWLALMFLSWFSMVSARRSIAFFAMLCWFLVTAAGNPVVSDRITRSIEEPFLRTKPLEAEALDSVVLLGGGADYTLFQQPELGKCGDRVGMAAELFHAGKVKQIICTGSPIAAVNVRNSPGPAELARQLLERLGVPADAIQTVEGRNTREEMKNLAAFFSESNVEDKSDYAPAIGKDIEKDSAKEYTKRIGLLTSAWHLPRALRLAEKENLKFEPVPADFLTNGIEFNALTVIPNASSLDNTSKVAKEYLAKWAGQ